MKRLKAKMMLEREENVSDGKVVEEIVEFASAHENQIVGKKRKTGKSIFDMVGAIKGGKRFNAEKEIDRVVYGLDRK